AAHRSPARGRAPCRRAPPRPRGRGTPRRLRVRALSQSLAGSWPGRRARCGAGGLGRPSWSASLRACAADAYGDAPSTIAPAAEAGTRDSRPPGRARAAPSALDPERGQRVGNGVLGGHVVPGLLDASLLVHQERGADDAHDLLAGGAHALAPHAPGVGNRVV